MLLNQQVCGDADGEIEIFKFQFILTFSYCGKKKFRLFYSVILHYTHTFHPNCDSYMSLMSSLPHSDKAV